MRSNFDPVFVDQYKEGTEAKLPRHGRFLELAILYKCSSWFR